jgi:hypothetical protein
MKYILTLCVVVLFSLPVLTFAAGVVPCGGNGEEACQACYLVELGSNLLGWFIGIISSIIFLVFVIGGLKMVMSGGSEGGVSEAKGMMTNAVIGFVIVLSAWLVVDTVLKMFVDNGKLGVWNRIECTAPIPLTDAQRSATNYTPATAGGTTGIVDAAEAMKNANCIYSQAQRNGCTGNPGYTDCSDLVNKTFAGNGCSSPGANTREQYSRASPVGSASSLKAGDALVYPGHVVICKDAGCTKVIHAAGTNRGIVESNSGWVLNTSGVKALRTSDFCPT